jgi:diaminopimelate decarboxylase
MDQSSGNIPPPVLEHPHFAYRNGELSCEQVGLCTVAQHFGTPLYVYSEEGIRRNYQRLSKKLSDLELTICYAVKANSTLAILDILHQEGSSFDIVSGGEFHRLAKIGVDPGKVIYTGVGKTVQELQLAVRQEIFCLAVESMSELSTLSEIATQERRNVRLSLRLNPEVDARTHPYISTGLQQHKFGLQISDLPECLRMISGNQLLSLIGIGSHIGSQILDVSPFFEVFDRLLEQAAEIRAEGFDIQFLDLGGGFGIPYRDQDSEPNLYSLAGYLRERRSNYRLLIEPGRSIVGTAGALICRVILNKTNHGKNFVVVDGGMNDLIRPALYQAYHHIVPVLEAEPSRLVDVVGPVCETADFLGSDRALPQLRPGDFLAVLDAGAYGSVLSSNYNSRPRPAEVLISSRGIRIIRRRESYDDLMDGEEWRDS